MLVVQALMAHARVLHLTNPANRQESFQGLRIVNEYADRASNTYRRLMLALAEYRKPPRGGDSFTAIKQANIAQQQVVMNGETSRAGNATNEQGDGPDARRRHEPREAPQALPAEPRGAGILAGIGPAREAVGAPPRPAGIPQTVGRAAEQRSGDARERGPGAARPARVLRRRR